MRMENSGAGGTHSFRLFYFPFEINFSTFFGMNFYKFQLPSERNTQNCRQYGNGAVFSYSKSFLKVSLLLLWDNEIFDLTSLARDKTVLLLRNQSSHCLWLCSIACRSGRDKVAEVSN